MVSRGARVDVVPWNHQLDQVRNAFTESGLITGVRKKSGPGVKSSNFSANIGPPETYYIPNRWKLNKAFAELCRFEIAALIE